MGTVTAHPANKEQLSAFKAFMKAFKISFEEDKLPYNPEFVAKIKQGLQGKKDRKGVKIDIKDLWK